MKFIKDIIGDQRARQANNAAFVDGEPPRSATALHEGGLDHIEFRSQEEASVKEDATDRLAAQLASLETEQSGRVTVESLDFLPNGQPQDLANTPSDDVLNAPSAASAMADVQTQDRTAENAVSVEAEAANPPSKDPDIDRDALAAIMGAAPQPEAPTPAPQHPDPYLLTQATAQEGELPAEGTTASRLAASREGPPDPDKANYRVFTRRRRPEADPAPEPETALAVGPATGVETAPASDTVAAIATEQKSEPLSAEGKEQNSAQNSGNIRAETFEVPAPAAGRAFGRRARREAARPLLDGGNHAAAGPDTNPSAAQHQGQSAGGDRVKTRLLGFNPGAFGAGRDPFALEAGDEEPGAGAARGQSCQFPVGWLAVVKGPGRGHVFAIFSGVASIGRAEGQNVRLDFGDTSISRVSHASLAYDPEQNGFFFGHGGKANLVRLNGRPVLSTEPLQSGDEIRVGETTLRFVALCGPEFDWNATAEAEGAAVGARTAGTTSMAENGLRDGTIQNRGDHAAGR